MILIAYWTKDSRSQWQSQPTENPNADGYTFTLSGTQHPPPESGLSTQKSSTEKENVIIKDDEEEAVDSQPLFLESQEEKVPLPEATLVSDSEDFEATLRSPPPPTRRQASQRQATQAQTQTKTRGRGKAKAKAVVSDFDDSEEEPKVVDDTLGVVDDMDVDLDSSPTKVKEREENATQGGGIGRGRPVRGGKKGVMLDDDSDDGMTFGRRKGR